MREERVMIVKINYKQGECFAETGKLRGIFGNNVKRSIKKFGQGGSIAGNNKAGCPQTCCSVENIGTEATV